MAEATVKVNKSEAARQVLASIGALVKNPPEGWRAKAEEELSKQGIKMHKVSLYQLRSKALKGKAPTAEVSKPKQKISQNENSSVSFGDIQTIRNLLNQRSSEELMQLIEILG